MPPITVILIFNLVLFSLLPLSSSLLILSSHLLSFLSLFLLLPLSSLSSHHCHYRFHRNYHWHLNSIRCYWQHPFVVIVVAISTILSYLLLSAQYYLTCCYHFFLPSYFLLLFLASTSVLHYYLSKQPISIFARSDWLP